jgi:hypothetical protein
MDTTVPADSVAAAAPSPTLPLLARCVAVFARPTQAWVGLKERPQWWFPLLIMVGCAALSSTLLYHRALVPMLTESWEQQVASGNMQPQQLDQIEKFFNSPAGLAISIGQQVVFLPIVILVIALAIWFGIGFVLGTGMKYRLALEVACWSFLIRLPEFITFTALAWFKGTMRGVHVGLGVLLPDMDPPSKLHVGLGAFLDALGPFSLWYIAVGIIGATALSGAPRKSVAWTLAIIYLVISVFLSALATLSTPAG